MLTREVEKLPHQWCHRTSLDDERAHGELGQRVLGQRLHELPSREPACSEERWHLGDHVTQLGQPEQVQVVVGDEHGLEFHLPIAEVPHARARSSPTRAGHAGEIFGSRERVGFQKRR